jgi:hypothetical protein
MCEDAWAFWQTSVVTLIKPCVASSCALEATTSTASPAAFS